MRLAAKTIATLLPGATAPGAVPGIETGQGQKQTGHHAPQDATVGLPNLTVRSACARARIDADDGPARSVLNFS